MSCYGPLAPWYDELTGDIPYAAFADYYEAEFNSRGGEFKLILDLCCGTGTLTCMMADRGYDMIGVDGSVDMLMQARDKSMEFENSPLFLCQQAAELDLYGTVDAAVCSLDGMNYIPPEELNEVFHRLKLFIRPGGVLIFDIRSPQWLRSMDGQVYVDEENDVLCLWRTEVQDSRVTYGMDIFSRAGELWAREQEEHTEYIYSFDELKALAQREGFYDIKSDDNGPQHEAGREFIIMSR